MKHIEFKRLEIKNFLSIGEVPLKITFQKGLNVITGTNFDKEDSRNGVGKCLDKKTTIDIRIEDEEVLAKYVAFCQNL